MKNVQMLVFTLQKALARRIRSSEGLCEGPSRDSGSQRDGERTFWVPGV